MSLKIDLKLDEQIFAQKLAALDLSEIAQRLTIAENWDSERTAQTLKDYRQFLYQVFLDAEAHLVPSPDVDQCWHYHILDTRKYAADCDALFGFFLHHDPTGRSWNNYCQRFACIISRS